MLHYDTQRIETLTGFPSTELHNVEQLELVSGLTVRLCTGGRLLV